VYVLLHFRPRLRSAKASRVRTIDDPVARALTAAFEYILNQA